MDVLGPGKHHQNAVRRVFESRVVQGFNPSAIQSGHHGCSSLRRVLHGHQPREEHTVVVHDIVREDRLQVIEGRDAVGKLFPLAHGGKAFRSGAEQHIALDQQAAPVRPLLFPVCDPRSICSREVPVSEQHIAVGIEIGLAGPGIRSHPDEVLLRKRVAVQKGIYLDGSIERIDDNGPLAGRVRTVTEMCDLVSFQGNPVAVGILFREIHIVVAHSHHKAPVIRDDRVLCGVVALAPNLVVYHQAAESAPLLRVIVAAVDIAEILDARDMFAKALEKHREEISGEADKVREAGGLFIIGTERHDSRRIDNQLRGRSGRQGDPGETQFYLSLEDDLMRLFGGDKMDRVSKMMVTADMGDDMPIQHKIISKAVENAQHKVESINFSMRKSVLEYDDVMNKQRQVIYAERNKILDGKDLTDHITEVMHDTVYRCVQEFCTKDSHDGERDLEGLRKWVVELTGHIDTPKFPDEDYEALAADVLAYVEKCYNMKAERLGEDLMRELNTQVMLRVIDTRWMNYLQEMDYLKTGIGLRGFGQRDPLVEYKTEAYGAFQILVDTMYEDYLRTVLRIEIKAAPRAVEHKEEPALEGARFSGPAEVDGDNGDSVLRKQAQVQARTAVQGGPAAVNNGGKVTTYRKSESDDPYVNVGRNDPCPCGSGKKFKYCHGRNR